MLEVLSSNIIGESLTIGGILICTFASLLFGIGIAGVYMVRNSYTKGFIVTLALLPAIVQIVIMMVNGNIGTGVAVAGAFSLIRFRSVPGTARDIISIFFAMAIGLATGIGYLLYALLFFIMIGLANLLLFLSPFGDGRGDTRTLRVTVPENLDYEGLFDDLLLEYTRGYSLDRVKTTNMGSLFELSYSITMKRGNQTKPFIDAIRCRNGNLNIVLSRGQDGKEGL